MNRILLSISMLLSTAVCALGTQHTITKTNNTGFIAYDFHLGLKENVVITAASSSVFTSWRVQHPNVQNVNTLINYSGGGTVAPGESASFYYTHVSPSTSITRLKWTAENGAELPSFSPGNSQSGYPGKLTAEWLYNLDNEMHGDYVAEYNAQTGQSLSGAVTISGIDYALSPTPIPPEQLEYFVLGGLLNFTPLSGPVVIPLGGDVELPPIVRDPQNDYIILRYRTTFTGDVHASTNEVFHASQTEPVPGPFCGDGACNDDENQCTCPQDCGSPPQSEIPNQTCADGLDNDCDDRPDCTDVDCIDDPSCAPPPQACCLSDGACQVLTHNNCVGQGGDPQGPQADSCDLTSCQPLKWSQPPTFNSNSSHFECFWGWDEVSVYAQPNLPIVADDWLCEDPRPVTDIHWWGSYWGWDGVQPPSGAPDQFHIGIWTDVPAGVDQPWSHPGVMIWEWTVARSELNERPVACDFHPDFMSNPEGCFRYDFTLPEADRFQQESASTVYWISIAAGYTGAPVDFQWGWKTREHFYNDDAMRIMFPIDPILGAEFTQGEPIEDGSGASWDMAFVLTSDRVIECSLNDECDDDDLCTFDRCVGGVCWSEEASYGDIAGSGGTCGPDGVIDLYDILAVLDAFQGDTAEGCTPYNCDLTSQLACVPEGVIDLLDILAVLDEFSGMDRCCAAPAGACCTAGSCADGVTEAECVAVGGSYRGEDTDCASTQCP